MNGVLFRNSAASFRRSLLLAGSLALLTILAACAHLPMAARVGGVTGPATIAGQVTSDRGAVIVDARVTLSGPSVHRTATTDIAGHFSFERVPIGRYVVSARATGVKGAKQSVTADKEGTVRADMKLRM